MIEVPLPYLILFICSICGTSSSDKASIEQCEAVTPWEQAELAEGDSVAIYQHNWLHKPNTSLPLVLENFSVTRLYYARHGQHVGLRPNQSQPKHHQLCITLEQSVDWQTNETWPSLDKSKYTGLLSFTSMTYAEFLLWREGDLEKLRAAGLIKPEKVQPQRRPWWQFWKPAAA